jgi:hypothetical protein
MIQMSLKDKPVQCSGRIPVESLETQQLSLTPSYLDSGVKEAESLSLPYTPCSEDVIKSPKVVEGSENENKPIPDISSAVYHLDKSVDKGSETVDLNLNPDTRSDSFSNTMLTVVTDILPDSATASFFSRDDNFSATVLSTDDNSRINLSILDSVLSSSTNVKSLVSRAQVPSSEERLERLVPITIWDFGGQEVFYTTHQTFLSSSCIYMMAFNLFEFWQELKHSKYESIIVSRRRRHF